VTEASPTTPSHHRPLSDAQRAAMSRVRDARRAFVAMLHELGGTDPKTGRLASANLTLALRHVEDAESRAVRHITGGPRE
jgi:hypothetical protein